jgi:hypothetical protein
LALPRLEAIGIRPSACDGLRSDAALQLAGDF